MTFFRFALSRPHLVLTGTPRLVPGKQWEVAVPMQCLFCLCWHSCQPARFVKFFRLGLDTGYLCPQVLLLPPTPHPLTTLKSGTSNTPLLGMGEWDTQQQPSSPNSTQLLPIPLMGRGFESCLIPPLPLSFCKSCMVVSCLTLEGGIYCHLESQ